MHLGMPFLYRSKNVNLENVPSHDSHKNLLIYFCYLDNKALPFWGVIWEYSEILNVILADDLRSSATFLSYYTLNV